jgi:hypothetical protein
MPDIWQRRHPLIFHNKMQQIYSKFGSIEAKKADFFLSPSDLFRYSNSEPIRKLTEQTKLAKLADIQAGDDKLPRYKASKFTHPVVVTQIHNPDGTKDLRDDSKPTDTIFLDYDLKDNNFIDDETVSSLFSLLGTSVRNVQRSLAGGIHLLVHCRYDSHNFQRAYDSVASYIYTETGLKFDKNAKKQTQPKYISFDEAHLFSDATYPFLIIEGREPINTGNKAVTTSIIGSRLYTFEHLLQFRDYLLTSRIQFPKLHYNDWFWFGCTLYTLFGDEAEVLFFEIAPILRQKQITRNYYNQFQYCIKFANKIGWSNDVQDAMLTKFFSKYGFKPSQKLNTTQYRVKKHCTEKLEAVMKAIEKHREITIVADTGTGKTRLAVEVCKLLNTTRGYKCAIIVPTRLQAEQLSRETGLPCWVSGDGDIELQIAYDKGIVILTLSGFVNVMPEHQKFDFGIYDEAHHIITHYDANFKAELIQSFQKMKPAQMLYLTGTPQVQYLNLIKMPVIELLSAVRKRYLYNAFSFRELNEVIEQIPIPENCTIIMGNSKKEIKKLEAIILGRYPDLTENQIGILHSDVRDVASDSDLFQSRVIYESIAHTGTIPEQVKFLLCTSILEEGINITNKVDSIHIIDSPSQYSSTRVIQASARYRNCDDLPVYVWYQRWRQEHNELKSFDDFLTIEKQSECRFSEKYNPELKKITRRDKHYHTPKEFRDIHLCAQAYKYYNRYANFVSLVTDLQATDKRFVYQIPEEGLEKDSSTYVSIKSILKKCNDAKLKMAFLYYLNPDMFLTTITIKKKTKHAVKGIEYKKVNPTEEYLSFFEEVKELLGLTMLIPTIKKLQGWGLTKDDIRILILAFTANRKLENNIFQRWIPTIIFRDEYFKTRFLERYTQQDYDQLTKEERQIKAWIDAGILQIGQAYDVARLLEFDKVPFTPITEKWYRGIVNDWFEVEAERKIEKGKKIQRSVVSGFHSYRIINKKIEDELAKLFKKLEYPADNQQLTPFDSKFWAANL